MPFLKKRIIVAGCRTFDDYDLCYDVLRRIKGNDITCLSGDQRGADTIGAEVSILLGWNKPEYFPADWDKYGLGAGPKRNREMADANATHLIAFWDGESRGTNDMIKVAKHKKILTKIIYYTGEQYERSKNLHM